MWEKGIGLATDPRPASRADGDALQGRTVFSVDLSAAMPVRLRAALRLPVERARRQRAAFRAQSLPAGVRSWDKEVAGAHRIPSRFPYPAGSDIAVLLHTGGTTGTPKAAMLTHTNLRANANQAIAWVPMLHEGGENFLCLLPFFHAFGLTFNLFCAVQKAATQVMLPKFSVDQVLAAHERRPFTFFVGVPVMFERILDGAQKRGTSLGTLRYGVCGAAPMPPEVGARWEKATGGFFVEGYGMTETSPIVAAWGRWDCPSRPRTCASWTPRSRTPTGRFPTASRASCWCAARRSSPATGRMRRPRRPRCCRVGGCARATSCVARTPSCGWPTASAS